MKLTALVKKEELNMILMARISLCYSDCLVGNDMKTCKYNFGIFRNGNSHEQ